MRTRHSRVRQSVALTTSILLFVLLTPGSVAAQNQAAENGPNAVPVDVCDAISAVLCADSNTAKGSHDLEAFRPTVTRASVSVFDVRAAQSAGQAIQTCRYTQTSYAAGNREGSANPSNSGFAVTNNFDIDVIGELQTGLLGGNLQGKVWAEAGVAIQLATDWPQPSSVTVTYPWEVEGLLSVDTDVNNLPLIGGMSSATASYLATAHLKQGDLAADPKVLVNETQAPGPLPGTASKNVQAFGTETTTVATPPGLVYQGYIRSELSMSANGLLLASAAARGDFANQDRGARLTPHMDWTFTIPPGYVIDCGNGTLPF